MSDISIDNEEKKKQADPQKNNKLASKYVEYICEQGRPPLYHKGKFYQYNDTHYVEMVELDQSIRTFFRKNGLPQSNNVIGNVKPIVQNMAWREAVSTQDLPFYVGKEPFPKRVLAYNNGLLDLDKFIQGDTTLMPHTPYWCSVVCLPHNYNPSRNLP